MASLTLIDTHRTELFLFALDHRDDKPMFTPSDARERETDAC
jgi:hypothetical protein